MPYQIIDDFAGGLDTRKSALTAPSGTLQRLNNCVVTPGGEIAKRKAFYHCCDVPGTFGLAATSNTLRFQTRNDATLTPPSSGVPGVAMHYAVLPTTSTTIYQTDFDVFAGALYLVCFDPAAVYPDNNPHFFHTVPTEGKGKGLYCRTFGTKMYSLLNANLNFSAVGDPTNWTTGTGAGFIDLSMQDSQGANLQGLETYYDKMAIFSPDAAEIWSLDPDPNQNVFDQVLRGAGSVAPQSSRQYGSGDVLFLNQSGIRSLRARDASNAAAVSDIGSPVDLDMQSIQVVKGATYYNKAVALIEPIIGRFWMIFPDQIYVLSYFPGPKITAWSRYTTPFTIDYAVTCGGHIFLRSGNAIYVYGGPDGNTYDTTAGEVRLPYLDMKRPGHNKIFEALDITVSGNWSAANSFDFTNPDAEETLGTFSQPTWRTGRCEFTGENSHFSLRFYTSGSGPALLSNVAVHYRMADDEA